VIIGDYNKFECPNCEHYVALHDREEEKPGSRYCSFKGCKCPLDFSLQTTLDSLESSLRDTNDR